MPRANFLVTARMRGEFADPSAESHVPEGRPVRGGLARTSVRIDDGRAAKITSDGVAFENGSDGVWFHNRSPLLRPSQNVPLVTAHSQKSGSHSPCHAASAGRSTGSPHLAPPPENPRQKNLPPARTDFRERFDRAIQFFLMLGDQRCPLESRDSAASDASDPRLCSGATFRCPLPLAI